MVIGCLNRYEKVIAIPSRMERADLNIAAK
jgi:hypothetical protein